MTEIMRKLQRTPKDQFTVTIPKTLVDILDWHDKDEIEFDYEDGALCIKRRRK